MLRQHLLVSLLLLATSLPGYSSSEEPTYTANFTGINQKGILVNMTVKVPTIAACERAIKIPIIRPAEKFLKTSGTCTMESEDLHELSIVCINYVKSPQENQQASMDEINITDEDIVGSKCTKSFNSEFTVERLEKILSEGKDIPGWHNIFK